ncbi:MAG: aerobic carbon-monoxide dehydrogenase medium subunit, partial [Thermoleophilaceae bacterium]|nr:aerobic carbon-monoxide dehydrogenase medium subunit [Thermoleophilaceae bacterium]
LRLARPDAVLDIAPLAELREYGRANGSLDVGALTTQRTLERDGSVREACPLLAQAIPYVGHAAIRNRGTIGGTVAHADPAAEVPVVLAALGGSVTLRSVAGKRTLSAAEYFKGFLMTDGRPDELLTTVHFPTTDANVGTAFEEFARRPGDFALVSVACAVEADDGGAVRSARVALGGVAGAPVVLGGLDQLAGMQGAQAADAAAQIADSAIDPTADVHGSAEYRRHLTRELVKRAFSRALQGRRR